MGPVSLDWYRTRGLTRVEHKVATEDSMLYNHSERYTSETITQHYSCGRIDVRGIPNEPYGDEISVPPMLSSDWSLFSNWLNDIKTMSVWTLDNLVDAYQQHNPPITWATE